MTARRCILLAAMLPLVALAAAGCSPRVADDVGDALPAEPIIRVRLLAHAPELRVDGPPAADVSDDRGRRLATLELPATVRLVAGRWQADNQPLPLPPRAPIRLGDDPNTTADLRVNGQPFPGFIRLLPRTRTQTTDANAFDVINHVHLEAYLPGVLDRELYDDWSLATYHAQAIAARSYAIHRIQQYGHTRDHDVEATQASQVYGGRGVNPTSIRAVLETTGLVLAERDRVVPAFYSSTCGGRGASPADTWGSTIGFDCLQPAVHPPWCRRSKHFQWGPVRRDLDDLRRRLADWGKARHSPLAKLAAIRTIVVSRRNPLDRPVEFTLTDAAGGRFALLADSFRTACNHATADRPLRSGLRLLSADIEIAMHAEHVDFSGRGYGHGVGMCQWGAQGMAEAGHHAEHILGVYYPGAAIQRAY